MKFIAILLFMVLAGCGTDSDEQPVQTSPPLYLEDSLKAFILSTKNISIIEAGNRLSAILDKAKNDSVGFRKTVSFLQQLLADPNSPFRNEDLYIRLLQSQIQSPWYIKEEKQVAQNKLQLASQNRVGAAANDFTYISAAGEKKKMYNIRAPFTLLYFYNPECNACKEMKAALLASSVVSKKIKSGEVKVLAMYTDRDQAPWRKHLAEYPREWMQGRDEDEYLYKNNIYDLKAIPTIYLLDTNKVVLLKDAMTVPEIEQRISK